MTPEWILAFTAAVGGLSGLVTMILSKRKLAAETESVTVGTASELVASVRSQLAYVDGELEKMRASEERLFAEVRSLRRKLRILIEFIADQGLEPPIDLELG